MAPTLSDPEMVGVGVESNGSGLPIEVNDSVFRSLLGEPVPGEKIAFWVEVLVSQFTTELGEAAPACR